METRTEEVHVVNSVGIDLHRNRSHVAVIDEHGELVLSKRIVTGRDAFLELLGGLEGESQIAVEATYGWEWLAELLEDAGYEMHLAHPSAHPRDRCGEGEDRRRGRQDARAPVARRPLPEAYVAPRELLTCASSCATASA